MPFDDSLIGSNDFDPRRATEDLIRRISDEPLPRTLDPRMLNTRLARKLGREPEAVDTPEPPTTKDQPALDFSSQAIPPQNMEPGGKNDLDFTSQVTPQPPQPDLGFTGNMGALAKGLPTGAVEGAGGVMKGVARATNDAAYPTTARENLAQPFDKFFGRETPPAPPPAPPVEQNPIYRAGQAVEGFHPNMSPQERDSIGGRVGTMVGGIAPYGAAALVGGPAVGVVAGFAGMAADTYGKVYEDALAKGADEATATTAAQKAAVAAGILGSLPLGTGKLAKSIVGKVVSQGALFATTNEATEYVLQEIAKDYDEHAGYTPEAKRIIASLITGGLLGGLHSFERKKAEPRQDTASDTRDQPAGAIPSPDESTMGPDEARQRAEQAARDHQWGRGPDDAAGAGAGSGPQPGPQGGPQPGGAKAKPGEQAKPEEPGAPPKGEGEDIPDDYTMDPKMRAKMERVYRTFDPKGNPSKMTDAELFRTVNDHLRDTSDTGYTAKADTAEDKAQREQHQSKQTEDAELKAAFAWMKDSQIEAMTPDMREVWLKRARGQKPGEKPAEAASTRDENLNTQQGERAASDATERAGTATNTGPDKVAETTADGSRKAPIAAKTADDVRAAQPVEPKSAAQAEAENYKHAHMELEHLGLKGEHSISIETGVGQTRKGPPGPDGKPSWEVKMEQGAYGRIKGTKGADGQPLDIMVGPHPSSPHVFIINQHDPATGKFDELKIQAGYRTPLDAMHAYAVSFDDHARGRVGGMVAMTPEQFHTWLKTGDHTAAVQHASNPASVLARAFPEAGNAAKGLDSNVGVSSEEVASSPGLHNAGEEAHRPLTEPSTEAAVAEGPKGSQAGDAKEATARPTDIIVQDGARSKAKTRNLSGYSDGASHSLLEFLADRGGLKPHPELEAIGFGGMHRIQIPGKKGFYGLIKSTGWDLDTAREAAEEAGYLQGDHPDATSTIRHLLDAMDTEVRGQKLYPYQGEGQRTGAEKRVDAEREAYEQSRAKELIDDLEASGHGELGPEIKSRVLSLMAQGMDPDAAVDHALAQLDKEEAELTPAEIDDTYGEGAYDEVLAGIPYESGPDGSRQGAEGARAEAAPPEQSGERAQAARAATVEGSDAGREAGTADQATGRDQSPAEGEPVREPARAKQRAAGRKQAARDEARDAARHEPAAEDADHAKAGVEHAGNVRASADESKHPIATYPGPDNMEARVYRNDDRKSFNVTLVDMDSGETIPTIKVVDSLAKAKEHAKKLVAPVAEAKPQPTTETGADNKQQTVIPGAEKASDKTMAQLGADAGLKPKVAQKSADIGLFGDERNQTDMFSTPPKKAPEPVKDEFDDIFDAAINEQFAKPVSLDQATEGLKAIFGKKPGDKLSDQTENLEGFSEETYAQALPYLKAGVASFANAGDLPAMVRALVSHLANSGMGADAIRAMKPYIRRFTDDVRSGKETLNAPSRREVLERDRGDAAAQDAVGAGDVSAPAERAGRGAGARGGEADAGDERPAGGERVPQDYAPVVGERGHLEIPEREPVADDSDAAAPESDRSADGGQEGFSFDDRTDDEAPEAAQRSADLNARRKAQADADAKRIPLKHGDLDNIAATLPMLFPEQHADVKAAEDRFAKADGHGMLFTNGTGTGKTYSGLGIIKRFALAGKKQAIVIAPSQGILMDWQKSAKDLGLDMHILDSTMDKGHPGLNGTTYANFGDNAHIVDHDWDLVVPDEAHKLSSDQNGTTTKALAALRALTFHPNGLMRRAEMVLRDLFDKIGPAQEKPSPAYEANRNRAIREFNAKAEPLIAKWREQKRTNKATFLSATPFAYHFSLDWAEGYLFDFDRSKDGQGGYNSADGRSSFYVQHLGYRMRTGSLTKPEAEVKQEVMERQLHEYLKKTGSLAGRMLTVDKDYDRKFILAHNAIGNQIDQALNFLQDNEEFRPLHDYVAKKFDYLTRMRLLEAIKAGSSIDYINQSLALGRKVVVFHDYNEGGGINPFDLSFSDKDKTTRYANGKHEDVALKPLYEEFLRQNPYVKELKFSDYPAPIATLTAAFPKALVYNGTVPAKKRNQAKALFNDDNSGHDLIIVQSAAGEAGISLHDTTGQHQRVTLNLGMPIRPVSSIQQEGRIYRVGQASDALFRYMNTGTDWERWTFAGKIADRAGTAENLALGNQARTIRQAFIDAFANAEDYKPEPGEGTGGKAADRATTHSMSEFEKAKTHYYAQAKNNAKRQNREGTDYYATAEPLGFKMVEWGNVKSGEKMLEPSAGHGAIARYFPEDTHRTLVEPSSSLASRASLNSTGARVVVGRFENLDTAANKQDVIVMNPPFGRSGKDATDHVIKAMKHLKNGGRIIALVPDVAVEKIDNALTKGFNVTALISLPPVAFERAGTGAKTTVMVIDKQTDAAVYEKMPYRKHYDLSNAETVGEMFDRIENLGVPDRLEPETKDVEAPTQGRITVDGIELDIIDDSKRNPDNPTFYASPRNKFRNRFKTVVGYAEKVGGRYSTPSFEFKSIGQRQAFLDMLAKPPAPEAAPTAPSGVTFKSAETTHSKTGKKLFVASPDQRVERAVYDQMNNAAKAEGGYYSSFTGRGAIPGFQFPSEEARAKFLAKMGGDKLGSTTETLAADRSERDDGFPAIEAGPDAPRGMEGQAYVLKWGRDTKNEHLIAFDQNGTIVADKMGTPDTIVMPQELVDLIRTPGADVVLHHNHPSGRSLSHIDISALANPGISTIWAHAHDGYVYAASLTDKAKARMPEDIVEGKGMLLLAYLQAEKIIKNALLAHLKTVPEGEARDQLFADLNVAWHQMVNSVLMAAEITTYRTNYSVPPSTYTVPGLSEGLKAAIKSARESFFDVSKKPIGSPDRYTHSVRHPGNVGVVFDRAALQPGVRRKADAAGARPRDDRGKEADRDVGAGGQYRLLDTIPGLDDSLSAIDYSLNDILGKRLLGKLGDLNATEMRVQLQDKFARIKNVEQDKGLTDTALSAYQAESLYYGRTGQRLEMLKEHVVDPIIREMKGRDISLDMMDKFLYARHAPERNNAVGALYPDGHDFKRATIDPRVKGASGMSTGEANSFIGRLRTDGKLADYQAVGRMVDALNFRTRQTLLNGGLIDRATFDGLNSQYRYYVPLRGWQEGSNEDTLPHQSKGMDTRAKAFKQAFGRESLAASPLAYSIMQAEQAIVKAEKNKVGNTFLKFARVNPDPDLWTIDRPDPRKYVSKVTGMVHSSPTWDMNDPSTFITRVDGRPVLIQFKGEDGGNLARALKNMGSSNIHAAVRMMGAVTHTMARLATAWNPEFMIPNLIRDIGEAFINLGEQRQKTFVRKFAAHILPAMKGSWMAIAEKTSSGSGQAYIDAFNEFDREGGRVRFFGIDDPDVIEKNVEKRLKRLSGGTVNSIKDLGDKAGKALEIMGGGIENATRLAAYMAAKDVGMSAPDAAMLARNLTVNFNKKGELGTAIGSAYMFANAGLQGQARMLRALHPKNRRVWMAVGALAVSGVLSTGFNLGVGGHDQAGKANYMKIPSWERDKNIIIMGPGETYGKIPLPYGFAPFHVLGAHATTVLMGQEKPTAAAAAVLGAIGSAFNPLGEEESIIGTLTPTAARPALHIHFNENWTGKPLYPARDADKGKPNSQQSFRTDTAASKAVAEGLNSMTGGDRYRPGAIDIHPGSLDHVMGAITGGVGRFVKNVVDTIMNGWSGQPWEAAKTPIIRRFVGKLDHNLADSAAYYDARKEATEDANRIRQAKRDIKSGANEQGAREFLDSSAAGRQKLIFDRADKQMRMLRAEEERINNSAQPYEAKKAALDEIRGRMREVQNRARAESARLRGLTQ